ncbi:CPBP family intramembrane glutamic endopeptidase [Bacillus sp. JJ722]|uniref:CPBP family intramembrane glutamic endopeptidase n=1 Tax=Bacillus sp. JJ722 TaxID=3122973 RepID=UPI002FFE485E
MNNKQAELIKNISDEVLVLNVWITQGIVLIVSAILAFFLFDSLSEFLSLFRFIDVMLIWGVVVGLLVVLNDVILMKILPPSLYDDGGINERIFRNLSYPNIFFLTLVIALCEEILFRGVIQYNTNIWIASAIFALVHYRYLFKPFLLVNITLLSLFIGLLFELTNNLMVTIIAHFIIDFLLGIIIKIKYIREKKDGL